MSNLALPISLWLPPNPDGPTASVKDSETVRCPAVRSMKDETPRQAEDRSLLASVARGEPAAFSALYDRLSGPLYTLCLRMVGDAAEAEDVLQEVFVTLWRRAATYDAAQSSVFGWSVHLARCKSIDHLRSRGRRLRVLVSPFPDSSDESSPARPPLHEAVATDAPDAAGQTDTNDRAGHVRRVLGELPPEQYAAIEMAFFGDLSHHEISARLGEPLGTIKARIRRGLLKMRNKLAGTR